MKYFIDGYEVSAETKLAWDRQQELNRQREYEQQQRNEEIELLRQIAENTKPR